MKSKLVITVILFVINFKKIAIRKKLFYLLLLISFISCDIDVPLFSDIVTYQKFSQEDYKFIPQKYKQQNDLHNFTSNLGQTITLKNNNYYFTEIVVYPSMTHTVYIDNVSINLNWNTLTECNHIEIKISKSSNNIIFYKLTIWTKNNGCNGITSSFSTSTTFSQLQIAGINYNYISIINLDNFFISVSNTKKINKIYYDLEKGFVGFENTQTNEQYWTN